MKCDEVATSVGCTTESLRRWYKEATRKGAGEVATGGGPRRRRDGRAAGRARAPARSAPVRRAICGRRARRRAPADPRGLPTASNLGRGTPQSASTRPGFFADDRQPAAAWTRTLGLLDDAVDGLGR